MGSGLYLSNLPYKITYDQLKTALTAQFSEIREAAEQNQLQLKLFSPKPSGKSIGAMTGTVSGFKFEFRSILERAVNFKIDGKRVIIKNDRGDERDEFGEFKTKLAPKVARLYQQLAGDSSRKVQFVFTDEFLQSLSQTVHSCLNNSSYVYLNGLPLETLANAGTLVHFVEVNKMKQYFMVNYSCTVECIQAMSLFNGQEAPTGKVTFVDNRTYLACRICRNAGLGMDGSVLNVKESVVESGFLPFKSLDKAILREISNIQGFCWRCGQLFTNIGICPDLKYIAGRCACIYDCGLDSMSSSRAFFWNEEKFTRLMPAKMDINFIPDHLIIFYEPMKTTYKDMKEYRAIVGPILFEEWKFYSCEFKEKHTAWNCTLDKLVFIEEIASDEGETKLVFHIELLVPATKFWSVANRLQIKKLTIEIQLKSQNVKTITMEKKVKVTKYLTDADGSLRLYARLQLPPKLLLFCQGGVKIVPKPDKTAYRSTISSLNKATTNECKGLRLFLGLESVAGKPNGITPKLLGSMHMFVQKLKAKLNQHQVEAFNLAKNSWISVVQGPPGTGKTYTAAVFSIIFQATEHGRILACCPSNFAADALSESISKRKREGPCRSGVLRVYAKGQESLMLDNGSAQTQPFATLHDAVRKHPLWLKGEGDDWDSIRQRLLSKQEHLMKEAELKKLEDHVKELERDVLLKYDIIVSTVDSLADHRVLETTEKHGITTLIIDEAAQLKQPCFPFLLRFKPSRVIVVGDHLQLRPQVESFAAGSAGLETSLMEWLKIGFCRIPWTMLMDQYRMQPEICDLVSKVTYGGKLKCPEIIQTRVNPFDDVFPEASSDIIYINHSCPEIRDGTSYHNPGEARLVEKLVRRITSSGTTLEDITIISLYDSQRNYLKAILPQEANIVNCNGFQGKENKLIIVSLTR